ncbi:hypothetical protein DPMN_133538 [Dreissena polymorpha]|uniref:Uncharacterized protein n=1 Tax=Dreissena polymorpha TaxID=45954 RepID=A0A9D4FY36_DREPO|nr:hypothetical protein DPMN_133538 [Dreissena polymorpha]
MLPMSHMNNNMTNMNLNNSGDMLNKGVGMMASTGQGQYPLSPPDNTSHVRHSDQASMHSNSTANTSQSQSMSNHISTNGTAASHMALPNHKSVPPTSQQATSVRDDLNFDPTAIIDVSLHSIGKCQFILDEF